MMTTEEAIAIVNSELSIDAVQTNTNNEIKCWRWDGEAGRSKTYLSAMDCDRLAEAFTALGASLIGKDTKGYQMKKNDPPTIFKSVRVTSDPGAAIRVTEYELTDATKALPPRDEGMLHHEDFVSFRTPAEGHSVGSRVLVTRGRDAGRTGMLLSWRACKDDVGWQVAYDVKDSASAPTWRGEPITERMYREARESVLEAKLETLTMKEQLESALNKGNASRIPMVLHCPECRTRHVDEGDFATKVHHTHSCQGCGLTWRPAVVATVGVQFLPGFKNEAEMRPDDATEERMIAACQGWLLEHSVERGHGDLLVPTGRESAKALAAFVARYGRERANQTSGDGVGPAHGNVSDQPAKPAAKGIER